MLTLCVILTTVLVVQLISPAKASTTVLIDPAGDTLAGYDITQVSFESNGYIRIEIQMVSIGTYMEAGKLILLDMDQNPTTALNGSADLGVTGIGPEYVIISEYTAIPQTELLSSYNPWIVARTLDTIYDLDKARITIYLAPSDIGLTTPGTVNIDVVVFTYESFVEDRVPDTGVAHVPITVMNYTQLDDALSHLKFSNDSMQVTYDSVQTQINDTQTQYDSLQTDYNSLQADYKSKQNELNNTRYITYGLATTTVVFAAATIYLTARKRKTSNKPLTSTEPPANRALKERMH